MHWNFAKNRNILIYFFLLPLVVAFLFFANPLRADTSEPVDQLKQDQNRYRESKRLMEMAQEVGDTAVAQRAREQMRKTERNMERNLAQLAGVKPEDVAAMRKAGMEWKQVCQELGMSPEIIEPEPGKQKAQIQSREQVQNRVRTQDQAHTSEPKQDGLQLQERTRLRERLHGDDRSELAEATRRQTKNGEASKHGMAAIEGGSSGMGLGMAENNYTHQHSHQHAGTQTQGGGGSDEKGGSGGTGGNGGSGSSGGNGGSSGSSGNDGSGGSGGNGRSGGSSGNGGSGGSGGNGKGGN